MSRLRNQIRQYHREFDGLIGRLFSNQKSLKKLGRDPFSKINPAQDDSLTYSRQDHFSKFHLMDVHQNQNPSTCDLKVYQDLFVYSYIIDNVRKGAKILEIGGGESRVIDAFKDDYEFWNLDRLEGQGHGPTSIYADSGFHLVRENIGNFSSELPEDYFDLVFSISVVEHFFEDENSLENIYADIQRILKKNAISLHCVDSLLHSDHIWFHPFIHKVTQSTDVVDLDKLSQQINADRHLWVLPKFAYYTRWFPKTKSTMKKFGQPFSVNLLWQKAGQ